MSETDLLEWSTHYVKARDSIERKLKTMEKLSDRVLVHYKDRDVAFFGENKLSTQHAAVDGFVTIVTLQTKQNFNVLVDNFASFAKNPKLTIIFVNPHANEKWLVKPAVHYAVADKSTLKTGLQSMYDTVAAV